MGLTGHACIGSQSSLLLVHLPADDYGSLFSEWHHAHAVMYTEHSITVVTV